MKDNINKQIEKDSLNIQLRYQRVKYLESYNKHKDIISDMEKVISIDSAQYDAYIMIARHYSMMQEFDKAKVWINKILQLGKNEKIKLSTEQQNTLKFKIEQYGKGKYAN